MNNKTKIATPIRSALRANSALRDSVADGLNAMDGSHRRYIAEEVRTSFVDSLEIDENLKEGRDQENRWDYLLGYAAGACVVGLEPHSANTGEVTTVIRKRKAALEQLRPHLKAGAKVAEWFWVASGKNRFLDTEKARQLLDQNGIRFVCPALAARDLAKLENQLPQNPQPGRRR